MKRNATTSAKRKSAPKKQRIIPYPEVKNADITFNHNITDVAQGFTLNALANGADAWQRVGRKILLKSVEMKIQVQPRAVTVSTDFPLERLRMLVVYDKGGSGVIPFLSDVIQDVSPAGVFSSNNRSFQNQNNKDRFIILKDKLITYPGYTTSGLTNIITNPDPWGGESQYDWNMKFKIPLNKMTIYSGTTAVTASINTGALTFYVVGANPGISSPYVLFCQSRLEYLDN